MSAKGNNPFALNKTNSFVITEEPLFLFYEINVGIIFQRLGTTAFKLYGSLKDISLLILFGSLWTHSDLKLIFLICRKSYDSNFTILISLVIVCLFVVVFESVFHQENKVLGLKFNIQEVDNIIAWINSQKSWATLFLQSFYILPTWLVFRYAPGYSRHTLPEGFFLQVC